MNKRNRISDEEKAFILSSLILLAGVMAIVVIGTLAIMLGATLISGI